MELRPYQSEAIASLWNHIRTREDNPVLVLPTGAGKGVILAQMAKDVIGWQGRMMIVSHVKELLVQTAGNIQAMAPEIPVGVYSAGLGAKETGYAVTVAGIQSCYEKAAEFGPLDIIAIDEAHRIPDDGEGIYRTFLEAAKQINPSVRLVGLTATPYRTGSGFIAKADNLLNKIAYEVGVRQLIVQGYLSPLRSKAAVNKIDTKGVGIRGGEFIQSELQQAIAQDQDKVALACYEIAQKTEDRKSVLFFATGIDHAKQIAQFLMDIT
jgi:DNA repair protein RadD